MSLLPHQVTALRNNFSFKFCSSALKYLGINIPPDPVHLYSTNYIPLMQRTLQDLKKYDSNLCSWFGRINILKLDIIPCFLYLFQTIPVFVPRSFFIILQSAFTKFIWGHKRSRLHRKMLSLPKTKGGAGAPDLYYYVAPVLTRLVNWFYRSDTKQWVSIEQWLD